MRPDVAAYLRIRTATACGFSPHGDKLLVTSDLPGTTQLFRSSPAGGDLVRLTHFDEPVSGRYLPAVHPDLPQAGGDLLLLAMDADGNERLQLYLMDDEDRQPTPLVVDQARIHRPGGMSRDGDRLAFTTNRRTGVDFDVWLLDLVTGRQHLLFAPGGWCTAHGFSPDGRLLAVSRLGERSGDNELYLVDTRDGAATQVAPHPDPAQVGAPAWLPDGSAFYFATSVGSEFARIARYDLASGSWCPVIDEGWDSGCAVDWSGRNLLVTVNADGWSRAQLRDPANGALRRELELPGRGVMQDAGFSRDGRLLAFGFSSALVPGDVWVHDVRNATTTRATTSPCEVDPAGFVEPQLVRIPSLDGEVLPSFVFRPRGPATGRWPVVLVLHGGPESQYRPSFSPLVQCLVAHGVAVVAPNVRGSTGYGRRYEHLDDVDRRLDAVEDLAAVHEWLAASDDLDAERAALYGASYGGYLVLAGLAFQPERWAAGVDVVGISSLVTFLRNTAPWRRGFREREYGSLDRDAPFLEAASPLTHAHRIRAPLLVIHGRNDPRVPLREAEQIVATVRSNGVPCELLVYDDEGHGLARLDNRLDAYPRVVAFLRQVLAGS